RGTMIRLVAGEKIEEQGRMHQVPALAPAEREDAAEQLLGFAAAEEMLLVGRPLVGIAGRNRDADIECPGEIQKCRDVLRGMAVEYRRVHIDGEAARLGGPDRRYGAIKYALLRHRLIVVVLKPIEMHGEEQIGRRFELIELLLQEEGV